ncbi:MAG: sn-glycerol-3-phosphate ABC transporter ATP-binding protein UgpC [Oscillospiraceae bacterium]|nr:sn-glycerol-3-phosphate ABC transporter ATP-binding protein UgpC [Oscillospiraceae bacterium]
MASLSFKSIGKTYPGGVTAVSDFNLEIKDKEFIIFVGPSGCGKSTTLRMVAGLEEITDGELYIGDRLINNVAPKDRDIAMVFQNYALYPHMTVYENMAFGLKLRKTPKEEIRKRVEEAARILDITHLLDRKPKALSGGQRQRVALGRAIVREPKVFLLDEPLSNLDAKLRAQMRTELSKLHKKLGTTFIYVTHDQTEAMTMADRIVVMKDGLIQQVDSPTNLYNKPTNVFVAGFIGTPQMNFVDAKVIDVDGKYAVEFGSEDTKTKKGVKYQVIIPDAKVKDTKIAEYVNKEVIMGIRPECIKDEEAFLANATTGKIKCKVEITELMGAETYLYINCEGINMTARVAPRTTVLSGDEIEMAIDANRLHVFDKDTESIIVY